MRLLRRLLTLLFIGGGIWPSEAAAEVIINEIMYHPGKGKMGEAEYRAEDTRKEYIELFNPGSVPVNLKGWRLSRGVTFTFPEVIVGGWGYLVVTAAHEVNRFKEAYETNYPPVMNGVVVGGWTGLLSNNGEEIELEDNLGRRVDLVSYSSQGDWSQRQEGEPFPGRPAWWRGWRWLSGADAGGRSLELINAALPNSYGQNWAASRSEGGTPGGPNSMAATDIAPMLLEVRHRPAIPKSTQSVMVTVRIIDEGGVLRSVALYHRLDGAADFAAVPMWDDGCHGDGAAGDLVYGALLPAQPDQTIVEFYVQATDAGGKSRTWPGPTDDEGGQGANALYQVDDTVYAGPQPVYRIVAPRAEWKAWSELTDQVSNGRFSDAQMNATWITVDGVSTEVRYNAGVRNRGAGTRTAHPHNLHLHIPGDRPWRNVTRLDLNTRTVHAQVAGNAIVSMAGLPNTYGVPVQVRINGNNLAHPAPTGGVDSYQFGSYYCFEPYGSEWAQAHFPLDGHGNLYRGTWYFDWVPLIHGADLAYRGDDPAAYRQLYSASGPTSETGAYAKQSNTAEDDWSDLIKLVRVLNTAPDTTYVQEVSQAVHIDEWLRYFGVTTLLGNLETTIGTGAGDDYSMYRGREDPRFQILTHDLDTVLGQGDAVPDLTRSIFKAAEVPAINRFLKHPEIAPRYYAVLKELTDMIFAAPCLDPLLDHWLGGWVPAATIRSMKDFGARRRANVLLQIPMNLTVVSSLPMSDGYPRTYANTASLGGYANAIQTRSVRVNGVLAAWTPWTAVWSVDNLELVPGINRILVQALDASGNELERSCIDVWFDSNRVTLFPGGSLSAHTTWSAKGGPYRLTANLTIPAGLTLTIEAGATVCFDGGAGLIINGKLVAQGTEHQRIRFTRQPGATDSWAGFQFVNARGSNILAYADVEFAAARGNVFYIDNSQVLIDHLTAAHNHTTTFDIRNPQVTIRHSVWGDVGAHYIMRVEGMPADGWFIIDSNLFGTCTGDNDIIHLNQVSRKGGPVAQIFNNVFLGGGDDIVDDNETDTHIEGNLFMHANLGNPGRSASAAVTTGPGGSGTRNLETQHLTIVRNVFFENDYAILSKTGAYSQVYNNVFVGNRGAILFDEPWRTDSGPGRAAYVESCIFWNNQSENATNASGTFVHVNNDAPEGHTQLTVNYSILPAAYHPYGTGNIDADPAFVRPTIESNLTALLPQFGAGFEGFDADPYLLKSGGIPDLHLLPGSPAEGSGFNGVDRGAYVPASASISGVPPSPTWQTRALLTVAGTDISGYKYRLIGPGLTNNWSAELAQIKSITSIIRNNTTATATVPSHGYANGDIIQIMGAEREAYNGLFTLVNVTPNTFDYPVTGTPPDQLPPKDITCRKPEAIHLSGMSNGTYTVEVIRKNSIGIWQSEAEATAATWTVDTHYTRLLIHEVLADNVVSYRFNGTSPQAVELYNDGSQGIDLTGLSLSDDPAQPRKFIFPAGTILEGGHYLVLQADPEVALPGYPLGFKLDRLGGALYLFDRPSRSGALIDSVTFGLQLPDLSIGRLAGGEWALTQPTLGGPNAAALTGEVATLKINEWLVAGRGRFAGGFVELSNPNPLPVPLAGLILANQSVGQRGLPAIGPLSFIASHGFAVFYPDDQPERGPNHLAFTLAPDLGAIGLFSSNLAPIDVVLYGPQTTDIAQGRSPNGASAFAGFPHSTPGAGNPGMTVLPAPTQTTTETQWQITSNSFWRFNPGIDEAASPDPAAWRFLSFDAAGWSLSPAPFSYGEANQGVTTGTFLNGMSNNYTCIFLRSTFLVTNVSTLTNLVLNAICDDGYIAWINGVEVHRYNMPTGIIAYNQTASAGVTEPAAYRSADLTNPANYLVSGSNVMAVQVFNVSKTSSDLRFDLELRNTVTQEVAMTNAIEYPVRLNEIMASPMAWSPREGAAWIELYNPGAQPVDLADVSLTEDVAKPRQWVFPTPSIVPGNGYQVIMSDGYHPASTTNTGYSLSGNGGAVYLFDAPARGGGLLDAVEFGLQAAGWSIGRLGEGAAWALNQPTPGLANARVQLGNPNALRINEWMANPLAGEDWLEIYNPEPQPVELSGLYLTGDLNQPAQSPIPPLSFIGAGLLAYQPFAADKAPEQGANHANFRLNAAGESIGLFSASETEIDRITFGPQAAGISTGRFPDGGTRVVQFDRTPSPGERNYLPLIVSLQVRESVQNQDNSFRLVISGPSDWEWIVQSSTNLADWISLATNRSPHGLWEYVDERTLSGVRFYRVLVRE